MADKHAARSQLGLRPLEPEQDITMRSFERLPKTGPAPEDGRFATAQNTANLLAGDDDGAQK